MSEYSYVGEELELFAAAVHWKDYLRSEIGPYQGRRVLEVGAGLGGTTRMLARGTEEKWVCLEPDLSLANQLRDKVIQGLLPPTCMVQVGTLAELDQSAHQHDTLLYIDVLEHIEDDRGELFVASEVLEPGGRLIVLSPAHPWLFTPFDQAIGHYRRYTRETLRALTPPGLHLERLVYLDSVGLLASIANKALLRQSMPTARQIAAWDGLMVPISRQIDRFLLNRLGKSVLAVWRKADVNSGAGVL